MNYATETAAAYREDPAHHEDAPELCSSCRAVLTADNTSGDDDESCFDCWMQECEVAELAAEVERIARELAEALDTYHRSRRASRESAEQRVRVELLRGCVRVMRQVIAPPPLPVCSCGEEMPTTVEIADGRCIACQRLAAQAEARYDESRGH